MALKYLGLTPKAKYCRRFATNKQYNFRTYATAMTRLIPFLFSVVFVCLLPLHACSAGEAESPEYSQVASILRKYCASCHNDDDRESGLSLDSYGAMLQGGKRGAVITPRRGDLSRLVRVLTGQSKPAMPPDDNKPPKPEAQAKEQRNLLRLRSLKLYCSEVAKRRQHLALGFSPRN